MKNPFIDLCTMELLLPAQPTAVERSAAQELQEHIQKMCGVVIPVLCEEEKTAGVDGIYVGATKLAPACRTQFPDNKFGEGWLIQAVDGQLILRGGKVRGVLYAVYHLLEDVFGVRWWSVWDESLPTLEKALVPADYESAGVPFMEYRDVFVWPVKTQSRFAVRNRLNGWGFPIEMAYGGAEEFGHPAHVHTFDRYFPEYGSDSGDVKTNWAAALNPEKESYIQTHPQWYAMTPRGVRVPKIICMSDPGLQQAMVDKMLKSIEFSFAEADAAGKTRPRYFDLSPADMPGECRCPRCAESIRMRGSSGHQVRFVNQIAEAVRKVYPEVIVETIIYGHYLLPPKDGTKPSENVVVRYCNSAMDLLHDIYHPNNRQYLEGLHTWTQLCAKGNLYLWDYGVFYNANGIVPTTYKLANNFRTFVETGVNGYFLEMEQCITTDMADLKIWVSTKLMEDPTQDAEALVDTFLNGFYGPAGVHIRRYLDAAHIRTEENTAYYGFGATSVINADGFTVEDIVFYDRCFRDAADAIGDDPVLERRLNHARMGLDRVIVENFAKWKAQAAHRGMEFSLDEGEVGRRIYRTLAQQIALRGQWDPVGAEVLPVYEKYLPDYVPATLEQAAQSEEVRLSRLHGCKDGWKGKSPVIVDPAELDTIGKDKLYVFTADTDFTGTIEPDPDSVIGVASRRDLAAIRHKRTMSEEVIQQKLAVADNDVEKCIPVGVYTGMLDEKGLPISAVWGTIHASDLVTDGKYHLYKFADIVAVAKDHGGMFHMFRDWGLLIHTFSWELGFLEGKKVDGYISMKVTGDLACLDPDAPVNYWIDRVILADK